MAANDNNILDLLNIVSSDSTEDFIKHINEFFIKCSITDCHIWDVIGNICEPCQYIHPDDYATFDIYELGFKEDEVFLKNINLENIKVYIFKNRIGHSVDKYLTP